MSQQLLTHGSIDKMAATPGPTLTPRTKTPEENILILTPGRGWRWIDLLDLLRYRELLWFLALRDIKVRYKQTVLGALWAVLQPLLTMLIFTLLFKLMGQVPADEQAAPYPVTVFCALLPWYLFANAVTQSSESLVTNQQLITKVYFPRLIVPIAPILSGLVDFAIAFLVLMGMMVWYGLVPGWALLLLPLFVLFAVVASLAISLWLSALNTLYRDFRYTIPFLVQIGFFISPVIYETTSLIPEPWQALYSINPMVGVLEGFRWALLGKPQPPWGSLLVSGGAVMVLLIGGLTYFRRMERFFADRV